MNNEWISINESLPEYDKKVLVGDIHFNEVYTARRIGTMKDVEQWIGTLPFNFKVTHWMELPKKPKK